jgi:hypothetical protein
VPPKGMRMGRYGFGEFDSTGGVGNMAIRVEHCEAAQAVFGVLSRRRQHEGFNQHANSESE